MPFLQQQQQKTLHADLPQAIMGKNIQDANQHDVMDAKMEIKILSFTHPHIDSNWYCLLFSLEHNLIDLSMQRAAVVLLIYYFVFYFFKNILILVNTWKHYAINRLQLFTIIKSHIGLEKHEGQ